MRFPLNTLNDAKAEGCRTGLCGSCFGFFKPIADIPDGVDETGVAGVRLDLAAQGGDAAVHAAVGHNHFVAPHGVQDAVPRQRAAGTLDEELQQAELLGGQLDLDARS